MAVRISGILPLGPGTEGLTTVLIRSVSRSPLATAALDGPPRTTVTLSPLDVELKLKVALAEANAAVNSPPASETCASPANV